MGAELRLGRGRGGPVRWEPGPADARWTCVVHFALSAYPCVLLLDHHARARPSLSHTHARAHAFPLQDNAAFFQEVFEVGRRFKVRACIVRCATAVRAGRAWTLRAMPAHWPCFTCPAPPPNHPPCVCALTACPRSAPLHSAPTPRPPAQRHLAAPPTHMLPCHPQIMSCEKMRSEYGKLMYMLMDSSDSNIQVGGKGGGGG